MTQIPMGAAPVQPEAEESLPRLSREVIVLTTLLQGVIVYGWNAGWWGGDPWARQIVLTTLLAVPAFFVLCVVQLRDRLLWNSMAVVALVVLGLNASVWWMGGDLNRSSATRMGTWWLCLAGLLLVALSWVQVLLQHRSLRRVPYRSLFEHAWNNAMVLPFAGLFVGLCWGILMLWAGLFAVLQVSFFAETFAQPAFICMATGGMVGVGVVMARGQPKALRMMLQLVLALCKLVLPLLSLVLVLFVLFLPFTGVEPLWSTGRASVLMVCLLLSMILAVNAVYQDGDAMSSPYPQPVQWLVEAAVVLMPVLALLAAWGLGLRVAQYGWTVQRIFAAMVVGVLLLYSLGYAVAALRRNQVLWLGGLGRWNMGMSWLVMALLVLLHTPLLSPERWSAAYQRDRLAQGYVPKSFAELQNLKLTHGRYGVAAIQSLREAPHLVDPVVQQWLANDVESPTTGVAAAVVELPKPVTESMEMAPGHVRPPADWWATLEGEALREAVALCTHSGSRCWVLQLPLEPAQPGQQAVLHPLVCHTGGVVPHCRVFARNAEGQWDSAGALRWQGLRAEQREQLRQAIASGSLQVQTPRWMEVTVPGVEMPRGQVRD